KLGGASVAADGSWSPTYLETLTAEVSGGVFDGEFKTTLRARTAVLLSLGNSTLTIAPASGDNPRVTPGSYATVSGQALAMVSASSVNPVPKLAGITGTITDVNKITRPLGLIATSPSWVTFQVPSDVAIGPATVRFGASRGVVTIASGN